MRTDGYTYTLTDWQTQTGFMSDAIIARTMGQIISLRWECIIIIIIERTDLGGVMSKDCKDTLQTLKTVTKRECDAKWEQSICQMRSWAELSRSGKLRVNSSVFSWRLKDASEDNDVRDLNRLFHVRAAATGKARSPHDYCVQGSPSRT